MPASFLKNYLKEINEVSKSVDPAGFRLLIEELAGVYTRQSNIFICGNGGSASTASHFTCDINKGLNFGMHKKYKTICLNDNIPTMLAYANDLSYEDIFVEQLKNFFQKTDLVIGISTSGNSKNVLKAIKYANKNGGRTFGFCGFSGGKLKDTAKKSIIINSNDMQKVEDMHMIIFHCAIKYLCNKMGR